MARLPALLAPIEGAKVPFEGRSLRIGPLDRFDRWSLAVIAVVFLILVARLDALKPSMSDTWYHLGVAKALVQSHGIPGWDWWNYAPVGRPHLYPPLLHLLIAFVSKFTGNVVLAGQVCAATFLPVAMLTIWYATRRLVDSRVALLALVVVLGDLFHFVVMEAYIASCLINILMPVLWVSFLARRPWWSILLMTLMYYSHLGFPHCVALGLLLFGLKYREYLRLALKVVGISLLFFTPWLAHVLGWLDWLAVLKEGGIPGGLLQKFFAMQAFNFVLLGLGLWGAFAAPRQDLGRRLPAFMLLGFLPILFSYGGRYQMHTMPAWALLAASVMRPLLPAAIPLRRLVGILLLPLLPLPSVGVFHGIAPLPITAAHMLGLLAVKGTSALGEGQKSERYREDCDRLATWLAEHTRPDEVIHVNKEWVADMVWLVGDRVTDYGAWWECSKQSAKLYNRCLRDWAPTATFVYIRPEADAGSLLWESRQMPGVDWKRPLGRFEIGVRKWRPLKVVGRAPRLEWRALQAAGATGRVTADKGKVVWTFRRDDKHLALISARLPAVKCDAVRFQVRANRTAGDVVFGIRLADGRDYRWPVSIPEAKRWHKVRPVFRWMTDERGRQFGGEKVVEVYLACPPGKPGRARAGPWRKKGTGKEWRVELLDFELLQEKDRPG